VLQLSDALLIVFLSYISIFGWRKPTKTLSNESSDVLGKAKF